MSIGPEDDDFGTEGISPITEQEVIAEFDLTELEAVEDLTALQAMADLEAETTRLD